MSVASPAGLATDEAALDRGHHGMNGTVHIVPRPLRAPAEGSSVITSVPLGSIPRPKAKAKLVGTGAPFAMPVVGWLPWSHGRWQVRAQVTIPPPAPLGAPDAVSGFGSSPPVR